MAALKKEYATADEVPEAIRSFYVEKDGKFCLDLDGSDDGPGLKSALAAERKARADAEKTLREIRSKLGDTDPAKAREALKMLADLEEKAALGDLPPTIMAKVEELVAKRTERMAADHKKRDEETTGQNKALTARLEELLIDNSIRSAAGKAGVKASAVEDAVLYGKTVWKLKDGHPVPMRGEEVIYGKEANKAQTMEEWIAERATDRAHWFEPSGGTGTTTATGAKITGNVATISRESAKDFGAYKAAKAQAEKAGAELVIQ